MNLGSIVGRGYSRGRRKRGGAELNLRLTIRGRGGVVEPKFHSWEGGLPRAAEKMERKRKKSKGDGAGLGRGPGETGDMPRRSREDAGGRAGEGLGKRTTELDRARDGPGRG